jgi:ribose transport system substrate-binding protein
MWFLLSFFSRATPPGHVKIIEMRKLLIGFLLLAAAACRRNEARVVGVVPKGANHIFWQTVHAGAIKAARECHFEIEWNAPTLEVDSSRQIEIVESMINRRLAGIVLAPVDRHALVAVVERAAREGIPVSIFDSAIDTTRIVSYVATNNTEGGRMAARRLGEILGGKGKVGIIGFMPGSASTMEREDGFQAEIHRGFPGIQIVGLQFGMADRARAMAETENLLTAHPDLAGLFADNESSSSGAVQALKPRGAKNVKLVAFDASDQLIADLRDGAIDSLVVQNPFRMGYESTRAIGLKLAGQTPAATIDSGATLVRREDLDRPDVRELLHPDIQRYLK